MHAAARPDHPAVLMVGSGAQVSFGELEQRSCRLARFWQEAGLQRGDHVAVLMDNNPRYYDVVWAALRSGLYLTTVNRYLTTEEASYIVDNCGARSLVVSAALAEIAVGMPALLPSCKTFLLTDSTDGNMIPGFESYETAVAACAPDPLDEEVWGTFMLYSSGTTGRPKGIYHPATFRPFSQSLPMHKRLTAIYGFTEDTIYLSPAPLYHSAPIGYSTGVQACGGTVAVMEKFDPVEVLRAIDTYWVTHSQWVPTMFVRMLKLPEADRSAFHLSTHKVAIHAAAPCPIDVKRRMIEWWGPILVEYWGATEGIGSTYINSEDWLQHPGSVGKASAGILHICDEEGEDLPPGEVGTLYVELPRRPFSYYGDEEKTRGSTHLVKENYFTVGDMGYLDEEGYLYLTDRKSFMIISGGVNIYPQEIENVLISHPSVEDVAVFGVPNEDFGEEVKAVVQLVAETDPSDTLTHELLSFTRDNLAHYKCPRSVDFIEEMPRLPTGKLYKRLLRDKYWGKHQTRIV